MMKRTPLWRCGLILPVLLTASNAPLEAGYHSRETPIVKAVAATRDSGVGLSVQTKSSKREGLGTAVVIDERGYLVTSHHVVKNAEKITAHFADGTDSQATTVAEERHQDLAILRVNATKKLQ